MSAVLPCNAAHYCSCFVTLTPLYPLPTACLDGLTNKTDCKVSHSDLTLRRVSLCETFFFGTAISFWFLHLGLTKCYIQWLPSAFRLQVSHIIEACCNFLEKQLDSTNCIGIGDFALQHGCTKLYLKVNEYIDQNFPAVRSQFVLEMTDLSGVCQPYLSSQAC